MMRLLRHTQLKGYSQMSLDFFKYQSCAVETAIYPEAGSGSFNAVSYAVLGLANEAGEVAGKLKKIWRDKGGVIDEAAQEQLASELGDVLWYAAALAEEIEFPLDAIARDNLAKLASRKERGVLGGSGDNR